MNFLQAIVSVVVVSIAVSGCGERSDADALKSAKVYLDKRDHAAATIELKSILQTNPSLAEARYLLGRVLLESGDATGAEIELRRAQEMKHPEAAVAPLLAKTLLALRQYKKLITQYAGADLADPQATAELQTSVALALAAQGEFDKARTVVVKALQADPQSVPATIAHARIKAGSGDLEGADAVLDELLAHAPTAYEGWQLKGDLKVHGKADANAAIESYRKALALRGDVASLHAALISQYFVQRDLAGATAQLAAMKKALPADPLTVFFEAQLNFARGEYKAAREGLQLVLSGATDNAGVLLLAGATELQLGALGQAEAHLSRAVLLQPNFEAARRLLARVHLRSNQPAKAVAVLRTAVEQPSADPETLTIAGQAHLLNNDPQGADRLFARAVKARPEDSRVRTSLALAQLARNEATSAFSELHSIAAADAGVAADMAIISARLKRKEFDEALKAIASLELKQPKSPLGPDLRGRVMLQRQDRGAARQNFEAAVSRDARYLPAIASLAALDLLERRPDAARARFEALLKLEPKNTQALLALAELQRRTGGSPEQVGKLIADAVSADPTDPQARLTLIEHRLGSGDVKAAVEAAQAGAAALPDNEALQESLARALLHSGEKNQASLLFAKMAAQRPDSHFGHLGLADINLAGADLEAAARNVKRALELAPDSLSVQRTAIAVAVRQKRHADAVVVARSVQTQRPNDSLGFILEGEIEVNRSRWDAAATAFKAALRKGNPAQAPGRLHFVLAKNNKAAEANRFAEEWLAQHPTDTLLALYMAEVASTEGDHALAERRYKQILKSQPAHPLALNNLASSLIVQKKPGAVAFAEQAVKAAPGQPALIDTLAMALSIENQHARAIDLQKGVVAKAPSAPVYRLTLAKIYMQAGDRKQARVELEQLAKLGREFVGHDEVATMLKFLGNS